MNDYVYFKLTPVGIKITVENINLETEIFSASGITVDDEADDLKQTGTMPPVKEKV